MSTFLGSGQVASQNLAIATGYGILDREYRKKLGMKVPKYKALSIFRELEGKMKPIEKTGRHSFYHYEEGDWFNAAVTITGAPVTGVANQVGITLSAADHFNAGTQSYPIVGNMAVFENETPGLVTAIDRSTPNAHIVTIKSLIGTNNVQTAAVTGGSVVFFGNAQAEESDSVEMRVPQYSKITNNIHTTRATYKVTDFAAQNKVEFTDPESGQPYIHYKGISETADTMSMNEELNLILSDYSNGLTNAGGKSVTTAGGLIPQITANGQSAEYFTDVDMATFDDMVLLIDDNYGDDQYMVGTGKNLSLALKNWLADFTKFDASYIYFDGGKEQALKFDFKGVNLGGVDFYFNTWDILSHKGSLGAGNMPYRHMGVLIPCGNGKDPISQEMVPYLQIRYSEPQGAAHEVQGDIKIFETGGNASKGATNAVMNRVVDFVSYKAIQITNREKFVVLRKAD